MMPVYFAAHTTACMTKQAMKALMQALMLQEEVKVRRCVASQIGGRMLTEIEAPDQETVEKFFKSRLLNWEWVMRIDIDAHDGAVTDY
jgi:hypothetical protein